MVKQLRSSLCRRLFSRWSTTPRELRWLSLLGCGLLVAWFVLPYFWLPFNTYPIDGWFEQKDMIFAWKAPGVSFFNPVALPTYYFKLLDVCLRLVSDAGPQVFAATAYFANRIVYLLPLLFLRKPLAGISRRLPSLFLIFYVSFGLFLSIHQVIETYRAEATLIPSFLLLQFFAARSLSQNPLGQSWRKVFFYGLAIGFWLLAKPNALLLVPVFFAIKAIGFPRQWRSILRQMFCVFAAVAIVFFAQTCANYARFDRFRLSDGTGRHLWNAVARDPEAIVGSEPNFKLLQKCAGGRHLRTLRFWDLHLVYENCEDLQTLELEDAEHLESFLKPMVISGILKHPWAFVKPGLLMTGQTLWNRPHVWSENDWIYLNPEFLRPQMRASRLLPKVQKSANRIYALVFPLTILLFLAGFFWIYALKRKLPGLPLPLLSFLMVSYPAYYLSNLLVEWSDSRYLLVAFPGLLLFLAIVLSKASPEPSSRI